MAHTDYTATVKQSVTGASTTVLRWNCFLAWWGKLINDPVAPYTVRGTSRNGTLGAAFSATPDGVDYLTGKTQTEVAGAGNPIWGVLQSSITGHQICFLLGTSSGPVSVITVVYAINKFETGGAWRGGGSGTATRPTDVTSSPTAARELNIAAAGFTPQSTSNEYWSMFVRKDGKGFIAHLMRDTSPSLTLDGFIMGALPLTDPPAADVNPYVAFAGNNQTMGGTPFLFTGTNGSCVGRLQDGTLQEHRSMDIDHASAWLDRLDAWRNQYPIHKIGLRSLTTHEVRYWLPDLFISSGSAPASSGLTTRDAKKKMHYNPADTYGLVGVWDASTTVGTDVAIYEFPTCPACPSGPVVATPPPTVPPTYAAPLLQAKIPDAGLDFGVDAACVEDVDSTFTLASGLQNVGMAQARRFITPRGGLFYDPDYGLDLREFLNAGVTDAQIANLPDDIRAEAEKDERIAKATVDLLFDRAAETMRITIVNQTAAGPFTLVMGISSVTVEILGLFAGSQAA
jgi:hypothetical protein